MAPGADGEQRPRAVSVLFVCLGNICRSPMAEAVFAHRTKSHPLISRIDSCGTGAYHVGADPDSRTMDVLRKHGISDYEHAARKVRPEDFLEFDYVFGMDSDNVDDLKRVLQRAAQKRMSMEGVGPNEPGLADLRLWGEFGKKDKKGRGEEVQDPYYGANDGFEVAYEQMNRFTKSFLEYLEEHQDFERPKAKA